MEDEINLSRRLDQLRDQHRYLDQTIDQLTRGSFHDQLQLGRLKKERLVLREQIEPTRLLIYAPRDLAEVDKVHGLVAESHAYARG